MTKTFKKRPLQESFDSKELTKQKRVKFPANNKGSTFEPDYAPSMKNQTKKLQFEKKISFADLENGDSEQQLGQKSRARQEKRGMSRTEKYAPKPGPKAPEVIQKRRERRQQKSLERKKQKAAKKASKSKRPAAAGAGESGRNSLQRLDELLNDANTLTREQSVDLQKLIGQLTSDEVKVFCGKVIRLISSAELRNERIKVLLIEKFGTILRSGQVVTDPSLLQRGLKFLALNAYFAAGEKAKNVCFFSERVREMFKVNLHRSLVAMFKTRGVTTVPGDQAKLAEDIGRKTAQNHLVSLNQLIDYLSSLLFDANSHFVCLQKSSKRTFEQIVVSQRHLRTELRSQSDASVINVLNAFITFYDLLLLCVFEDVNGVKDTFEELEQCLGHVKRDLLCQKDMISENSEQPNQPKWADVLSDIVISYLLKPSQLVRNAVTSVFALIKEHISEEAVEQICLALISDENEEEHPDEEDNVPEEDDEQFSDMDTVSELGEEVEDEHDESEASEQSDNEDEDEEDEEENDDEEDDDEDLDEVDEEFRCKLKMALGKAALESDEEQDEKEQKDEEDDEDMDNVNDDEMLEFDEALAEVFRERKNQKKKSKNVSHLEFKSRCLDLVEQLISRKNITSTQLLNLAEKLFEMNQKSLNNKTTDLIRRSSYILCQISKVSKSVNDLTASEASERIVKLFQTSIELSNSVQDKGVQNHLYDFCIWCISSNTKLGLTNDWTPIVGKTIERYFKSGNFKLSSTFFIRLCTINKEHIEQIINEFSHSLKENKLRPFQRTGAYQVLIAAIKNADDQNVANLQPSLLQQHLTSLELILPEIKKNMSLLFNNQVIFLAILLNKFETVLAPKVKQAFISGLTKIANDSKCKRSLSKEAKIRLRQFVTKPIMS